MVRDGTIYVAHGWPGLVPLSKSHFVLYLDPRSGLLRRNKLLIARRSEKREKKTALAKAVAARLRSLGPWRQLHLLADGNWWDVELAPVGADSPSKDAIEKAQLSPLPRAERYGQSSVLAVSKRPLSRREVVAMKLRD